LPTLSLLAPCDLADPQKVHGVVAVDPQETVRLEVAHQFAQLPQVSLQVLTASPDEGIVSIRLEQVDLLGVDGHPEVLGEVEENTVDWGMFGHDVQ